MWQTLDGSVDSFSDELMVPMAQADAFVAVDAVDAVDCSCSDSHTMNPHNSNNHFRRDNVVNTTVLVALVAAMPMVGVVDTNFHCNEHLVH